MLIKFEKLNKYLFKIHFSLRKWNPIKKNCKKYKKIEFKPEKVLNKLNKYFNKTYECILFFFDVFRKSFFQIKKLNIFNYCNIPGRVV